MTSPVVIMDSLLDAAKVSFVGQPVKLDRKQLDSPYGLHLVLDGQGLDMVATHDQLAEARAKLLEAMGVLL